MAKWSDYLISAVRYYKDSISQLKVHKDLGDKVGQEQIWSKEEVVSSIKNYNSFCTIYKNSAGNWTKGEDVHVVTVGYSTYLRTDRNNIAKDNLGNLPVF